MLTFYKTIRLQPGVRCIARQSGQTFFISIDARPVHVSPIARELWPALVEGARFEQLVAHLRAVRPSAKDVEDRLASFLTTLANAGLLAHERALDSSPLPQRARKQRRFVWRPSPFFASPTGNLIAASRFLRYSTLFGLFAIFAAATISIARWLPKAPPFSAQFIHHFSFLGLAATVLIAFPLHELGHALVARVFGVPVVEVGIAGYIPRPYVYTPQAFERSRGVRFAIAAAGPASDWLFAAMAAVLSHAGIGGDAARFVFATMLLFALTGTSPLHEGDGSHMLEAVVDDELARRAAILGRWSPLSNRRSISNYRLGALLHTAVSVVLIISLLR